MTIEKQLEVLRKALEEGMNISIGIHFNKSPEEAEAKMKDYAGSLGLKFEHHQVDDDFRYHEWFSTGVSSAGGIAIASHFSYEKERSA